MIKLLRVHPLFWFILVGSVLVGQFIEIITLFAIVFIHELGHYAAAKMFGWRVTEIQILPFGGVAKVDESGNIPVKEEIIVAIAGPLQNGVMVLIAILFFKLGFWNAAWTTFFIEANLTIALFNLLPIVPLDGGRIVQCFMSLWLKYRVAIDLSHYVSLTLSFLLFIIAVGPGSFPLQLQLLGMSVFFIYANWIGLKHAHYQYVRFLLARHKRSSKKRVVKTQPLVVSPSMKIIEIAMLMYRERYHVFYITEKNESHHRAIPEERILYYYFHLKKPESAIGQLLS